MPKSYTRWLLPLFLAAVLFVCLSLGMRVAAAAGHAADAAATGARPATSPPSPPPGGCAPTARHRTFWERI